MAEREEAVEAGGEPHEAAAAIAALRAENAKLRSDLRRAWTTELRMVERAKELATALSKVRASSASTPGEVTPPPSPLKPINGHDFTQPAKCRSTRASVPSPPSEVAPRSAPVRRRTVDGAPMGSGNNMGNISNYGKISTPTRTRTLHAGPAESEVNV